jgi:predicted phosphodiesterase
VTDRPQGAPEGRSSRPSARRIATALLAIAVGVAGAWAALALFGGVHATLGPFEVRFDAGFGRGVTRVSLPPLGDLTADTHVSPLRIDATLEGVHVQQLADQLRERGAAAILDDLQNVLPGRVRALAIRAALVAVSGALVLALIVFRTRLRLVGVAVASALTLILLSEAATYLTYDAQAFRQPTFSGSLALAPQLIGPVETATGRIDRFRDELARVVDGAVRAYASITAAPTTSADEIRVLHISDIHLSPLGMAYAQQLARAFDVDFVLDTGDITSFGTPAETLILSQVPGFERPYVFVRGNHDSIALQNEMAKVPNAVVLDGSTVVEGGLTVYGLGDPAFTPNKLSVLDDARFAALVRSVDPRIAADVAAMPRPPDIVAVHDERMAESVAGSVPLVVSGHFHVPSNRTVDGTLYLQIGSTGGAGANVFTQEEGIPLSAEILHFRPADGEEPPALLAWDVISESPVSGNLTIERHVPPPASEPSPGPTASGSPT